jgi:hypothetical protein
VDVFLVPAGRGGFELYSETDDRPDPGVAESAPRGAWSRLVHRFRVALADAEREQERREAGIVADRAHPTMGERVKARVLRWMAERIAEQRLLWLLRGQREARLLIPAGLDPARAEKTLRSMLKRDADRHLAWSVVNGVVFVVSGLVAWLPGPNLLAYYFAFRLVGHVLSVRGARRGLSGVRWTIEPREALADLMRLDGLPPQERAARVRASADALGLRRLPRFFARTTSPAC